MARSIRGYWIKAAPIQRLMHQWMDENEHEINEGGMASRTAQLAQLVWPDSEPRSRERRIRILLTQEHIDFDTADRVLCRMDMVQAWITDPELSEVYWSANLKLLDHARPTSPKVKRTLGKAMRATYERIGTVDGVIREVGMSREVVRKYLLHVKSAGEVGTEHLRRRREQQRAA